LQGGDFTFPLNTVGGTTAFIFGAVLAKGVSNLHNAAIEPEIVDLCHMLCAMGAKISGIGTRDLVIEGVSSLTGVTHNILPDRIELGTYLVAAAMTKGHLTCHNADTALLPGFEALFTGIGCPLKIGDNQIALDARDCELSGFSVQTDPYPGFPTDLQAQFMALACVVNGESVIEERIFENRFMHVPELIRLGANIRIDHSTAHIKGVKSLSGAEVMATDLRASVAMVLAGLAALGTTTINRVYHIDRGYEHVEEKLLRCGARIKRLPG
jgi:UDP-N-acetylglucosamine 1-carboxyvinyltransferase